MKRTILAGNIGGEITAVASKSHMHRLLLCAALSEGETILRHGALCEDIDATCRCIEALGAGVRREKGLTRVRGIGAARPASAVLDCGESGATYRFLLGIAPALGVETEFLLSGRLPKRPVDDLLGQLRAHGVRAEGLGSAKVRLSGRLSGGEFVLPGNVSSQYITALLFAMALTGEECTLQVTGRFESASYVELTLDCLRRFGVRIDREGNIFRCPAGQRFASPGEAAADGDWSNAAFALCAAAASQGSVRIRGLNIDSVQGDKAVLEVIRLFGAQAEMQGDTACVRGGALRSCRIDIGPIPDMAPAISLMGALAQGETVIANAGRLRLKESDRIESTISMLHALGAEAWCENDEIHIRGTGGRKLPGGTVDPFADHRIAMTASCAAALCTGPVTVPGSSCTAKSYPSFYDDLPLLGLKEATV